ncbi:hypothetical protein VaNZ11_010537, partial [Volvox africanus]
HAWSYEAAVSIGTHTTQNWLVTSSIRHKIVASGFCRVLILQVLLPTFPTKVDFMLSWPEEGGCSTGIFNTTRSGSAIPTAPVRLPTGAMVGNSNAAGAPQSPALTGLTLDSVEAFVQSSSSNFFSRQPSYLGHRAGPIRLTSGTLAFGQPNPGLTGSNTKDMPADLRIPSLTLPTNGGCLPSNSSSISPTQTRTRESETSMWAAYALASVPQVIEKACGTLPARSMAARMSIRNLIKAYTDGSLTNFISNGDSSSLPISDGHQGSSDGKAPTVVTGVKASEQLLQSPYYNSHQEERVKTSTKRGSLDGVAANVLEWQPLASLDEPPRVQGVTNWAKLHWNGNETCMALEPSSKKMRIDMAGYPGQLPATSGTGSCRMDSPGV